MSAAVLGIFGVCFVMLSARRLGYEWKNGGPELGLAAMAFALAMIVPDMAALVAIGPWFLIAGHVLMAAGAFLLYLGALKTASQESV